MKKNEILLKDLTLAFKNLLSILWTKLCLKDIDFFLTQQLKIVELTYIHAETHTHTYIQIDR